MPKVGKTQFMWKLGDRESYPINFLTKSGEFMFVIPEKYVLLAGVNNLKDKTIDGLNKQIGELQIAILAKKTATRKVIVYELEASGGDDGFGKHTVTTLYCGHSGATGVKLNYRVCEEESVDGRKNYSAGGRSYDDFLSLVDTDPGKRVVDWTEEREKFFSDLYESLSAAAVRAHEFLCGDGDRVVAIDDAIARKAGNLLTYAPEKAKPEVKNGK